MYNVYISNAKGGSSAETLMFGIPYSATGPVVENPIVKGEMGKSESFDFAMEPDSPFYSSLLPMHTNLRVEYDGDTIFSGRVLDISIDYWGKKQVHCEGALAYLLDTFQSPSKEDKRPKITLGQYIQNILAKHNEQIAGDPVKVIYPGYIPGSYGGLDSAQQVRNDEKKFGVTNWTASLKAIQEQISQYGGYLRVRYENGHNYLDLIDQYFRNWDDSMDTMEVAKNIIDRSMKLDPNSLFTVLIPYGTKKNSDFHLNADSWPAGAAPSNPMYFPVSALVGVCSGSELTTPFVTPELYSKATANYGTIYKAQKFENAKTRDDLFKFAKEFIKDTYHGVTPVLTVKAIDLHLIGQAANKYKVGDVVKIRCQNEDNDEQELRTLCIKSVQYDLCNPENNSYIICIPWNELNKTYGTPDKGGGGGGGSGVTDPKSDEVDGESNWWARMFKQIDGTLAMYHNLIEHGENPWEIDTWFPDEEVKTQNEDESEKEFQTADLVQDEQLMTTKDGDMKLFATKADLMKAKKIKTNALLMNKLYYKEVEYHPGAITDKDGAVHIVLER